LGFEVRNSKWQKGNAGMRIGHRDQHELKLNFKIMSDQVAAAPLGEGIFLFHRIR
jgi:hypothetical protein